jgi:hypothetical protein
LVGAPVCANATPDSPASIITAAARIAMRLIAIASSLYFFIT